MAAKKCLKVLLLIMMGVSLISCAAEKPKPTPTLFEPVDLNAKLDHMVNRVNHFMIIFDASQSMSAPYKDTGHTHFTFAKDLVSRLNKTIPDVDMTGAFRTFGHGTCLPQAKTLLINSIEEHSAQRMEQGLAEVTCDGGNSPLGQAINSASDDYQVVDGNIALIIISDGKQMGRKDVEILPLSAAEKMKAVYGPRLCIYTVQVGDDPKGEMLLKDIANVGQCGFYVNADDIYSQEGMANFVETVFLAMDSDGDGVADDFDECPDTPKGVQVDSRGCPLDSDGDGVPDYLDKCPDTTVGVEVDEKGCPLDSDGDGVPDYLDKCPGTPPGVMVDENGCATFKGVQFKFDKYDIEPQFYPNLDGVASTLERNPQFKLKIEGYTDNVGTEEYNQKLSEKRAKAVMDYLIQKGISPDRLSMEGYGTSNAVAPNDTEEGRAQNRRAVWMLIE